MKIEVKEIITTIKDKPIFIYGAGYDGKLVHHILEVNGISINGFFVDDGYLMQNNYIGIEITEYSKFKEIALKDVFIIVAMNTNTNKTHNIQKLSNLGFEKIIDFDRNIINQFLQYNANNYISNYIIDVSKEYIKLKTHNNIDFFILNPYFLSEDFKIAFALEMPDLIIPVIDDNFTFMSEGKYEYKNVVVNENDIVIDCGANIGIFSSIAAAKNAVVYAFEPVPSLINILKKLVKIYPNINIAPYALSNTIGKINFSVSEINTTSHSFLNNDNPTHHLNDDCKIITVDTTTIDEFVKLKKLARVDYIKADIEGAERFMLNGAREVLKRFAPKISICTYHLPDDKEVLSNIILEANPKYIIEHKWHKLYAYVPK